MQTKLPLQTARMQGVPPQTLWHMAPPPHLQQLGLLQQRVHGVVLAAAHRRAKALRSRAGPGQARSWVGALLRASQRWRNVRRRLSKRLHAQKARVCVPHLEHVCGHVKGAVAALGGRHATQLQRGEWGNSKSQLSSGSEKLRCHACKGNSGVAPPTGRCKALQRPDPTPHSSPGSVQSRSAALPWRGWPPAARAPRRTCCPPVGEEGSRR